MITKKRASSRRLLAPGDVKAQALDLEFTLNLMLEEPIASEVVNKWHLVI